MEYVFFFFFLIGIDGICLFCGLMIIFGTGSEYQAVTVFFSIITSLYYTGPFLPSFFLTPRRRDFALTNKRLV